MLFLAVLYIFFNKFASCVYFVLLLTVSTPFKHSFRIIQVTRPLHCKFSVVVLIIVSFLFALIIISFLLCSFFICFLNSATTHHFSHFLRRISTVPFHSQKNRQSIHIHPKINSKSMKN